MRGLKNMLTHACASCVFHRIEGLESLGSQHSTYDYLVALAGNPNTGKSTLFNRLTGLRQHTGNWPGKTVERKEGYFRYGGKVYKIVDLPGTYSLMTTSEDEEVARNFLMFDKPDVTLMVADATRLERNLNLILQILQITPKAVLALNMMDEAAKSGIRIDTRHLSRLLGIPVVATNARSGQGVEELLHTLDQVARGEIKVKPYRIDRWPGDLQEAIRPVEQSLKKLLPALPNKQWVAIRLLSGCPTTLQALQEPGKYFGVKPAVEDYREQLEKLLDSKTYSSQIS